MLGNALQCLPGKVQPVKSRIMALERGDDAKRLRIMIETAIPRHACRERFLAGMAERRVAEIMGKRDRLGQILVQTERPGDRAGDLRHLDRMRQPGPVIIAFMLDEYLSLVL